MREENLKLVQQDIDEALKTVEALEEGIDKDEISRDDIKEKFLSLNNKLKTEGIL